MLAEAQKPKEHMHIIKLVIIILNISSSANTALGDLFEN